MQITEPAPNDKVSLVNNAIFSNVNGFSSFEVDS